MTALMRRSNSAARIACAALVVSTFSGLTGARALGLDWCRSVPVEGSFCRALPLDAPRAHLRLALADDDARRERGLMNVHRIPVDEGMLFVYPELSNRRHEFWMKSTFIALDMVFVGVDGVVTDVATNVPASKRGMTDDQVARHIGFGRYVIELSAGAAARDGLTVGVHLAMPLLGAS